MGITVGSWWIDGSGQRMVVKRMPDSNGRPPNRYPCYLEGRRLYLAWLSEAEIRGAWKHWRPRRTPRPYIPSWLRDGRGDVSLKMDGELEPLWLVVQGMHLGWICLSGMVQYQNVQVTYVDKKGTRTPGGQFYWSLQQYDTIFLPLVEALPRMAPMFTCPTQWDRIAGEDDPISPQPRITPFTHDGPRDPGPVDDGLDLELS